MKWPRIARLLGGALAGFALTLLLPVIWAIVYQEWDSLRSFGITIAGTIAVGGALRFYGRSAADIDHIFRREALFVVAASWILIPVVGAIPFLLDGVFTSPIDAVFESVSGFSTTGATVLSEIETAMSRSMHFWRLQTHWLGGMGIMVLFVAVLPSLGVGGKMLFKNEVPGPITEGLKPRIRETSNILWRIYIALTLVQAILLFALTPMDLWNALGHAMSTLGTGGFSTQNESIAGFDSASAEIIISVFMMLAGVNFSLYFLLVQRKWSVALRDREFIAYVSLVVVTSILVSVTIVDRHGSVATAFRHGVFQVLAIVSTTGFGTDDFDSYPAFSRNLLFFLMFVGGSAGSTAGGIKVFRFIVLMKAGYAQIFRTFRPQSVVPVKVHGTIIPDATVRSISSFFFAYMSVFVAAAVVMSTMMPDLESAMSSTIACLGNVGPGLASVGPTQNYGFIPDAGKLVLTGCMLLGRLELYTFLVIFVPAFWRR